MNTMITDAALTDQQIYDRFAFLEGLVSDATYRHIASVAIQIQKAALPLLAAPEAGNPVSVEGTWQHEVDCIANNLGEALEGCDDRASAVAAITPYIDELFALAARQPVGKIIAWRHRAGNYSHMVISDQTKEALKNGEDLAQIEAINTAYCIPLYEELPDQTEHNGKLVAWWNGITPGYDGQGVPSIRWGADAENSAHDIPLYDGLNPIHYQQPAQELDAGLYAWLNERGIFPDANDGQIDMSEVIEALNEHERQLMQPAQVDLEQFRELAKDFLTSAIAAAASDQATTAYAECGNELLDLINQQEVPHSL